MRIFRSLYCLVFGWAVMVAINGDSNPRPFGMPIVACISFPLIFSSSPTRTVFWRVNSFRLCKIFSILSAGRLIHLVVPSKSHPKISFLVDQRPSPCFNFFTEMGSSSWSSVGSGGGNTVWIPCRTARVKWSSSVCECPADIPIKSSMYTSSACTSCVTCPWSSLGSCVVSGMHKSSNLWRTNGSLLSKYSCAISRAVSDAVQNSGGDSHHPIWRHVGTTISVGSSGCAFGRR